MKKYHSLQFNQGSRVWSKGSDLRSFALRFVGSNPTSGIALLAQLVERKTFNLVVVGSSPTEGKESLPQVTIGFVVKLVITVDFESTIPGSNPGETSFLYSSVGRALGC